MAARQSDIETAEEEYAQAKREGNSIAQAGERLIEVLKSWGTRRSALNADRIWTWGRIAEVWHEFGSADPQAELKRREAELKQANWVLVGAITELQYAGKEDEDGSSMQIAQAELAVAEAEVGVKQAEVNVSILKGDSTQIAEAKVDVAQAKLKQAKLTETDIELAKAALAAAQAELNLAEAAEDDERAKELLKKQLAHAQAELARLQSTSLPPPPDTLANSGVARRLWNRGTLLVTQRDGISRIPEGYLPVVKVERPSWMVTLMREQEAHTVEEGAQENSEAEEHKDEVHEQVDPGRDLDDAASEGEQVDPGRDDDDADTNEEHENRGEQVDPGRDLDDAASEGEQVDLGRDDDDADTNEGEQGANQDGDEWYARFDQMKMQLERLHRGEVLQTEEYEAGPVELVQYLLSSTRRGIAHALAWLEITHVRAVAQEAAVLTRRVLLVDFVFGSCVVPVMRRGREFQANTLSWVANDTRPVDRAIVQPVRVRGVKTEVEIPLVLAEGKAENGAIEADDRRVCIAVTASLLEVVNLVTAVEDDGERRELWGDVVAQFAVVGIAWTETLVRRWVGFVAMRPTETEDAAAYQLGQDYVIVLQDLDAVPLEGDDALVCGLAALQGRVAASADILRKLPPVVFSERRITGARMWLPWGETVITPVGPAARAGANGGGVDDRGGNFDAGADMAREVALSWAELRGSYLQTVSLRRRRFTNCTPAPGHDPDPLAHEWLTSVWRAHVKGLAVVAKLGGQGVRELEARALLRRTDGLAPLLRCATFHDPVYRNYSATVMLFPWLQSHHEAPDLFYRRDWRVLLRGMLRGLRSLHEVGVAHLDIKPDNVMADGVADVVLVDLGLALKVGPGSVEANGWGTPGFQAPEIKLYDGSSGGRRFGVAADLFSVGMTLREFARWQRRLPAAVAFDDLVAAPSLADALACLTHESPEARGTAEQWLVKLEQTSACLTHESPEARHAKLGRASRSSRALQPRDGNVTTVAAAASQKVATRRFGETGLENDVVG